MNPKKMKYHNCNLKYKNGSRKIIKKNEICIFRGTHEKWIKCKRYGNRVTRGRFISMKQRKIS